MLQRHQIETFIATKRAALKKYEALLSDNATIQLDIDQLNLLSKVERKKTFDNMLSRLQHKIWKSKKNKDHNKLAQLNMELNLLTDYIQIADLTLINTPNRRTPACLISGEKSTSLTDIDNVLPILVMISKIQYQNLNDYNDNRKTFIPESQQPRSLRLPTVNNKPIDLATTSKETLNVIGRSLLLEKLLNNPTFYHENGKPREYPIAYRKNKIKNIEIIEYCVNGKTVTEVNLDFKKPLTQSEITILTKIFPSYPTMNINEFYKVHYTQLFPEWEAILDEDRNYLELETLLFLKDVYKNNYQSEALELVHKYHNDKNGKWQTNHLMNRIYEADQTNENQGFLRLVMKKLQFQIQNDLLKRMLPAFEEWFLASSNEEMRYNYRHYAKLQLDLVRDAFHAIELNLVHHFNEQIRNFCTDYDEAEINTGIDTDHDKSENKIDTRKLTENFLKDIFQIIHTAATVTAEAQANSKLGTNEHFRPLITLQNLIEAGSLTEIESNFNTTHFTPLIEKNRPQFINLKNMLINILYIFSEDNAVNIFSENLKKCIRIIEKMEQDNDYSILEIKDLFHEINKIKNSLKREIYPPQKEKPTYFIADSLAEALNPLAGELAMILPSFKKYLTPNETDEFTIEFNKHIQSLLINPEKPDEDSINFMMECLSKNRLNTDVAIFLTRIISKYKLNDVVDFVPTLEKFVNDNLNQIRTSPYDPEKLVSKTEELIQASAPLIHEYRKNELISATQSAYAWQKFKSSPANTLVLTESLTKNKQQEINDFVKKLQNPPTLNDSDTSKWFQQKGAVEGYAKWVKENLLAASRWINSNRRTNAPKNIQEAMFNLQTECLDLLLNSDLFEIDQHPNPFTQQLTDIRERLTKGTRSADTHMTGINKMRDILNHADKQKEHPLVTLLKLQQCAIERTDDQNRAESWWSYSDLWGRGREPWADTLYKDIKNTNYLDLISLKKEITLENTPVTQTGYQSQRSLLFQ